MANHSNRHRSSIYFVGYVVDYGGVKMKIPKKLEEKRDLLAAAHAKEYEEEYAPSVMVLAQENEYKEAFNAACNLLLPEIEKMRAALESVAAEHLDISHFENHEDIDGIKEMVRFDMQLCRKTLQSWQRFIEVGES